MPTSMRKTGMYVQGKSRVTCRSTMNEQTSKEYAKKALHWYSMLQQHPSRPFFRVGVHHAVGKAETSGPH